MSEPDPIVRRRREVALSCAALVWADADGFTDVDVTNMAADFEEWMARPAGEPPA